MLFSKFILAVSASIIIILTFELMDKVIIGLLFGFLNNDYQMCVSSMYKYELTKVGGQGHLL